MPDSPKPIVSALIVSHNTKDLLLQCMHALFASADVPVEAVVVDNDSSDGSAPAAAPENPQAAGPTPEPNLRLRRPPQSRLARRPCPCLPPIHPPVARL